MNPKDSSFVLYKNIAYGFSAFVVLLLLIRRRKIIYIILLLLIIALFVIDIDPFSEIKIAPNTKVQILPTKNSTIFFVTKKRLYVQKIGSRDDYLKIILPKW